MTDTIALVFDIDDTLYRQIDLLQSACEEAMGGKKLPDPELFYQIFGKRSYEMFLESSAGRKLAIAATFPSSCITSIFCSVKYVSK